MYLKSTVTRPTMSSLILYLSLEIILTNRLIYGHDSVHFCPSCPCPYTRDIRDLVSECNRSSVVLSQGEVVLYQRKVSSLPSSMEHQVRKSGVLLHIIVIVPYSRVLFRYTVTPTPSPEDSLPLFFSSILRTTPLEFRSQRVPFSCLGFPYPTLTWVGVPCHYKNILDS